ncbi:MAG: hypothetical protein IE933_13775 [Sphingomonadales bacterium]|nr:hypothetical protein [Sphingomonadales bacterium]MBD3775049.1 hypothetical protein [Paracoccaceae bacterium]
MRLLLTALIFAGGLFYLFMGLGFMLDAANSGADFGLVGQGAKGLATMRADMGAFFIVAAICMMFGAWKRNGDFLVPAALLFLVALIGRGVGIAMDGTYDGFWPPMLIEFATAAIVLYASRVLPHLET